MGYYDEKVEEEKVDGHIVGHAEEWPEDQDVEVELEEEDSEDDDRRRRRLY